VITIAISNGILGLLCRLHFLGLFEFGRVQELAYTWDHYVTFSDLPDRDGRVFTYKVERVMAELWVSHHRTTLVNTSHLLDILEIIIGYITCIWRISLDAMRDTRPGPLLWPIKPVINS